MDIVSVYEELIQQIDARQVLKEEEMKKHTSFKIGGKADIFVKAKTIFDIQTTIQIAKKHQVPFYIIGNGSNLLVKDKGIRGIVIAMQMEEYTIEQDNEDIKVKAQAGVKLAILAQQCLKQEIAGLEFASGIPGTIGGAIRMNAGAHGSEMKDIVKETTYMDEDGNVTTITNQEQQFQYRSSLFCHKPYIILETVLQLQKGKKQEIQEKMDSYATYRKQKQPIQYPSAGSTFKRGTDYITAQLIDACGLKGYSVGGAQISEIHAGFIVNSQNATAQDVLALVKQVQDKVAEKFNKKIELEIEVIGE